MHPTAHRVDSRATLAAVAASLLIAGCGTVPSAEDLRDGDTITRHAGAYRMTVDARFDEVWPEVVAVVERRGYADVELEQSSSRENYRITGEQENQPRDKEFRETVTEKRGRIVATTADGGVVPLELEEQHEWEMSVLDQMAALSGGSERYRLAHDGVEISMGTADEGRIDRGEAEAVLDAIHARFDGDST